MDSGPMTTIFLIGMFETFDPYISIQCSPISRQESVKARWYVLEAEDMRCLLKYNGIEEGINGESTNAELSSFYLVISHMPV